MKLQKDVDNLVLHGYDILFNHVYQEKLQQEKIQIAKKLGMIVELIYPFTILKCNEDDLDLPIHHHDIQNVNFLYRAFIKEKKKRGKVISEAIYIFTH